MGGGRARELCVDPELTSHGMQLLPWGGVAAKIDGNAHGDAVSGRPYCLLPLPCTSGLPVHVNGFFEMSSNRRDIWHGDDGMGGGRLRSEWNRALLCDVIAPSYVQLLLEARQLLRAHAVDFFYELWPQQRPAPPWDSCLLYTSPSPRDKRQSRMPSSA